MSDQSLATDELRDVAPFDRGDIHAEIYRATVPLILITDLDMACRVTDHEDMPDGEQCGRREGHGGSHAPVPGLLDGISLTRRQAIRLRDWLTEATS